MNKQLIIGFLILLGQVSFSQNNIEEERYNAVEKLKNEVQKISDLVVIHLDKGIKQLKTVDDKTKIASFLNSKLKYYEKKIDQKVRSFHNKAHELGFPKNGYDAVYEQLDAILRPTVEKCKYLNENDVNVQWRFQ